MNKKFNKPEIEVIKFELSDVIATSGGDNPLSKLFSSGFDMGSTTADNVNTWD